MECLEKGQDVVIEIEMQGARQIKEIYPEGSIYICFTTISK